MSNINTAVALTTSFVQDQKHLSKSEKFSVIQPSQIGTIMTKLGFQLVHLKTGQAKNPDRQDHQTTIARYRSETPMSINGLFLDIVFKVPHLYGALQAFLGTYRQVCSNGLVVGQKFFEYPRVRHTGDVLFQIEEIVRILVAKHNDLSDSIREMQAKDVTPSQIATFVREIASQRLSQTENIVSIDYAKLLVPRRDADSGQDAFTVLNVVQENIMRNGFSYQVESTDKDGIKKIRNMTARPIMRRETETSRSVDLNASIWDAASRILMAA